MTNTKVGSILSRLLNEHHLSVSELARRVKLPQPTIQRIATGVCEYPHVSSLKPLADFFSISIDQLRGLETIPQFDNIFRLPLINWEEASVWNQKHKTKSENYIVVDVKVSSQAYALTVMDGAMEPIFLQGTTLILDPDVSPIDRNYIIVLLKNANIPIFRQLIIDGQNKLLKPLSLDKNIYKISRLKAADKILATVVQARWNLK